MKILINIISLLKIICTIFLITLFKKITDISFLVILIFIVLLNFINIKIIKKHHKELILENNINVISNKFLLVSLLFLLINKDPRIIILLYCEILLSVIEQIYFFTNKKIYLNNITKFKTCIILLTIGFSYINLMIITIPKIIITLLIFISFIIQLLVILKSVNVLILQKNKKILK